MQTPQTNYYKAALENLKILKNGKVGYSSHYGTFIANDYLVQALMIRKPKNDMPEEARKKLEENGLIFEFVQPFTQEHLYMTQKELEKYAKIIHNSKIDDKYIKKATTIDDKF